MAESSRLLATIDRIERDEKGRACAVLVFDDGQQLVVPSDRLPKGARPQQVVALSLEIDAEETRRRTDRVRRQQKDLFG